MKGDELRVARNFLELTQEQLAGELGVSPNTVARWERDERSIPPTIKVALELLEIRKELKTWPRETRMPVICKLNPANADLNIFQEGKEYEAIYQPEGEPQFYKVWPDCATLSKIVSHHEFKLYFDLVDKVRIKKPDREQKAASKKGKAK